MVNDRLALAARPTLSAWIGEYDEIEREYRDSLAAQGVDFAPSRRGEAEIEAAKDRLRAKGACFRNGGASIATGPLSSACRACSNDLGSKTFVLSMRCNRDCYFCFNANQDGEPGRPSPGEAWRDEWSEFAASCERVTHVGLSGGEPLLHKRESVEFVRTVRDACPDAHVRLYTAGDFLDEPILEELRDAGLRELRMSIKLDVLDADASDGIVEAAVGKLALAQRFVPDVLVEMPAIPGTGEAMRRLLDRLDGIGTFGVNLLEFGFPMSDWSAFRERGFEVRNPPFAIPYDYSYPGGLPIDGSELLCLELLEYAIDRGLSIGVHYCSLENKIRGQVYRQNAAVRPVPALYELDADDFFYKAAKVFDGDVPLARRRLAALGVPFALDEQDGSLLFHPGRLAALEDEPVLPALSYNVGERSENGCALRELKLEIAKRG